MIFEYLVTLFTSFANIIEEVQYVSMDSLFTYGEFFRL